MANLIELADRLKEKPTKAPKAADRLVSLAMDRGAMFWHTPQGEGWATIPVNNHFEHYPVRRKGFKAWLAEAFYKENTSTPGSQALQDATDALEGKALFDGPEFTTHLRVAEHGGNVYLDLGGPDWDAVEITPQGWRVVTDVPVHFSRSRGTAPLPIPVAGGSIHELRPFVNVGNDGDFMLLCAVTVAAMRPNGPYPVLVLGGEQGSSKSTTARVVRALVDPNTVPLRATPREDRDVLAAANNSHLITFDNLSGAPAWLSDAICRLASGGGWGSRALFTDSEEILIEACRPVCVNGLDAIATRPDLQDRAIVLTLPQIPEDRRRDESSFWTDFETAHPRILGALCDAVSTGLRRLPDVHLDRLPRMADFALWAEACGPAFGWLPGDFMTVYAVNIKQATDETLDASPVATTIMLVMKEHAQITGTSSDLLAELEAYVPENRRTGRHGWRGTPRWLSDQLTRLAPILRQRGVEITRHRDAGTGRRLVTITQKEIS